MDRKVCCKSGSFMQRFCEMYKSDNGLASDKALCLAADGCRIYIGTDCGLNYTDKDCISFRTFPCGSVEVIHCTGSKVFFADGNVLYVLENDTVKEVQTFAEKITGISGDDRIFLVTHEHIYELNGDRFDGYFGNELPVDGISVVNNRIVAFADRSLMLFPGKRKCWRSIFSDHSDMPEFRINDIAVEKLTGYVYLATDKGLYLYDNRCGWYGHKEIDSFPEEIIYSVFVADDGRVALGTEAGLAVIENGKCKHLPATRWTCEEKVNDALFCGNDIWTATDSGVSRIFEKEMTLRKKADYCFEHTEKYFVRKDGFVTSRVNIENCDIETGKVQITDNDGLWTQVYVGALAYAYAVTKDEKILEKARRSMNACSILTKITGIKGFTARAVRYPDEPGYGKNLDMKIDGGEWHKAPDGIVEWLGETSSDEMTGHFFGFSLYYDFCADEEEKAKIREILCDIVDHILGHNYRLHDIDGLPTTWACWDPAQLNGNNMWMWEKCINSLEILTFLDVAYHVSGDEKYRKEFLRLAIDEHYILNAAQHKKDDGRVTHIDDNLGFLCTATILRIEEDPIIRSYLIKGLRHFWNYERSEHCIPWNLIFGVFCDDVCDIDYAVKGLRDMPLDFVFRYMFNSQRKDLVWDNEQEYWGGDKQLRVPLEIDERVLHKYDTSPFLCDDGNPRCANSPAIYLFPYWFARYYGIIDEE